MREKRIPDIVSNIKVTSYNKSIIDVRFSILEIFQSHLRKIWINVHQKLNWPAIEKKNARNIPMIRISFYKEKLKCDSLILIYIMTLGTSWMFNGFLEWLGISTKFFPSLLEKLGIECIIDYGGSWMNIMLKSFCASKIVLVSKLFLWMFWENILIYFIIMLKNHS